MLRPLTFIESHASLPSLFFGPGGTECQPIIGRYEVSWWILIGRQ